MNRNSNTYTIIYAIVLTVLVAVLLTVAALGLKSQQKENIEKEKKQQVLGAVSGILAEKNEFVTFDNAAEFWTQYNMDANMFTVNTQGERLEGVNAFSIEPKKQFSRGEMLADAQLPVFVANIDGKTYYIMCMFGAGLWGEIWGYLSVEADGNTIAGVTFDHASETAGLGAKIKDDPSWGNGFVGKHLFVDGEFLSVSVVKKGKTADGDYVDAISGATLTCVGVSDMIKNSIQGYVPFLQSLQTSNNQ